MNKRFMTKAEVARLFGVSIRTVELWTRAGHLPAYRLGDRTLRFDRAELESWIAGQRIPAHA